MSEAVLEFPQLKAAPIQEAVVDFRVKVNSDIKVESLLEFTKYFGKKFTVKAHNQNLSADFEWTGKETSAPILSQKLIGYAFESEDKEYIVQVNLDSLTISRIRSYSSWEDLMREVEQIWSCYSKLVGEFVVRRTAVRYINKLVLPGPYLEFDDYLTAAPIVPHGLPQEMTEFLTRNVIPVRGSNAAVILTQAFQAGIEPLVEVPVILDIDVFTEQEYSSIEKIQWDILNKLRVVKNQTFFSSITEKTLELYL